MKPSRRFAKIFVSVYTVFFLVLYLPRFIGVDSAGAFEHVRYVWQDFLFQHGGAAVKPGDPRLILVAADDDTVHKYGFPLPRIEYARALDRLKALGVKTAVFDVMFFEPARGDAALAAATRRFGRVVHLFAQDLELTPHGMVVKTSLPIKPLMTATRWFGHPNITDLLDGDGHIRSFALFRSGVPDPLRPQFDAVSLEAAAISAYEGISLDDVRARYGSAPHLMNFRAVKTWLAHPRDAGLSNAEKVYSPYLRISLIDLLSGKLTGEQKAALKGSLTIIGSTTLGYYDHYPTPFLETAPGADFHLNAIDNTLHHDGLGAWTRLAIVLCILAAMLLTYLYQYFAPAVGAALAGSTVVGWLVFCLWMFRRGTFVEFVPPAAAMLSAYLVLVVHRALTEGAEKKMIKGLFGQFVAPEVVEQLASDPSKVKLGGEKRELTIFFLDIAHFTNISEKMDPEALIQFLNKYLSSLSRVILERRGTIDKYIGDCIMAFWNAPIENPDHRADAVLAALECQRAIRELNKTLDKSLPEVPAVRIGINSGVATVGLTGSEKKLQYTVIGDEVNLASRLEGANKFFGSKVIISESAWEGAKGRVVARVLGRVRVIGKETPIKIYEPIAEAGALSPEWEKALPLYEAGVAAFDARRYEEALAALEKFAELLPDDGPGQLYLARCREYAAIPPDASWDGVFNMTAK
ncbi:MAG: CHASE2 domain-containing protein [Elusimicrobia bacterium]|nr:CHASE2 domain-containing protein [Elusimicrobiota bacterium]